jgi:hypothetical protein
MTATEVENKLLTIERKSGEDLYSLADRVRNLANRAHMTEHKKKAVMRQAFFTALRGNSELQHWVNRYDDPDRPDMNLTLDLAIEWEHQHGTVYKGEKVRQVEAFTDETDQLDETSGPDRSETESVNKIDYIPLKEMTTEEGRRLARQNNELVSLIKKQAYTVLDDDKKKFQGSKSYRSSNRSTSSWSNSTRSSSRRSRSRDKRYKENRGRKKSREGERRAPKDQRKDWKDKKKHKYPKDRKKEKVEEVREQSTSSGESSRSHSRSEQSTSESSE